MEFHGRLLRGFDRVVSSTMGLNRDMDVDQFTCDLEVARPVGVVLIKVLVAILLPRSKRLDVKRECELMLRTKHINRETLGGLAPCGFHTDNGSWGFYDRSHI